EWRALDHVALTESHEPVPNDPDDVFDHFHVNSIQVDHDGNLLISARHTDTVYKLDRRTGRVIWRLGGKRSDFDFGPGARFHSQHDARRQPDGDLTLFDNSNPPKVREESRAIRLRLDETTMTASLVQAIDHPLQLSSESQGNAQVLPGGDVMVSWGSQPYFSRFSPSGRLRFDAQFPPDTDIYRAYHASWRGRPPGRPAISVDVVDDELTAYASWNGATEIRRWELLTGPRPDQLSPVASSRWEGFESTLTAEHDQRYVAVRAVDDSGDTLGVSRVRRPRL
ncbi:MAG: arylsulfotransferase family protein, partial [Nocardioidaceae bacterium]